MALLVVGAFGALAVAFSHDPEGRPTPSRKCRSLPTVVVQYGIAVHVVDRELYLCFQQGGAQGMTEITCVPMRDCVP